MSNFNMENDMGYLATMTEDERVIFLKVLAKLAMSDGEFDDEEKLFIREMGLVLGVPESRYDEIKTKASDEEIVEAVKLIKDRKKAMALIKEMCLLANSDGDLSDDEVLLIGRVGQSMGLELEKVEQISQWVIDRIVWLEQGKIIFEKV
ncbi:MAG: TerB family tellurite resistance protein [Alphaproteobacteria bacterium]|nr:TerB family tellurite resistance protein [Alphaproteobacteria bacterium]MBQ7285759.1 TerB family tellurite resistance protein [Alphaproteobacteria bacterium]